MPEPGSKHQFRFCRRTDFQVAPQRRNLVNHSNHQAPVRDATDPSGRGARGFGRILRLVDVLANER
jgi:hypothetical protein